jgi:hypothetical protein
MRLPPHADPAARPRHPLVPSAAGVLAALGLVLGAVLAAPAQDAGIGRRFPTITADALSGREYSLPRDFAGQANLVFVAFTRDQQALVDSWVPHVRRLTRDVPTLRFYELPTLARGYRLMSPVIAGGMKGGVTDPAMRDATITLYTDVDAFRRTLALPDDDTAYVLLLDARGVVRWRTRGPFTPDAGAALDRAVGTLLGGADSTSTPR